MVNVEHARSDELTVIDIFFLLWGKWSQLIYTHFCSLALPKVFYTVASFTHIVVLEAAMQGDNLIRSN